mmetsp:Transcript_17599/g.53220  ORF Transcript_17599/g.53220 Transcript_17599/m.53220 type:complete len:475 (-) Transcript_17599:288-1712(-)
MCVPPDSLGTLPPFSLLEVRETSKGRGCFATRDIEAGSPLIVERPLALSHISTSSAGTTKHSHDGSVGDAWDVAAELACAVVRRGVVAATALLVPRTNLREHGDSHMHAKRVAPRVEAMARKSIDGNGTTCPIAGELSLDSSARLVQVAAFNGMELGIPSAGAPRYQALFARASMLNHSCSPNALQMGFIPRHQCTQSLALTRDDRAEGGRAFSRVEDGLWHESSDNPRCVEGEDIWLCVRAVVPIQAGEEVTISYVADLTQVHQERVVALAHHGFEPESRACDAWLEGWTRRTGTRSGDGALPQEQGASGPESAFSYNERQMWQERLEKLVSVADADWKCGQALAARAGESGSASRAKFMAAANLYAQLLQQGSSVLDSRHAMLTHARGRLATLMTASKAERSCRNALPLWRDVLAATRLCLPSAWPQLLPLLRSARDAAAAAGDFLSRDAYTSEIEQITSILRTSCEDIAIV